MADETEREYGSIENYILNDSYGCNMARRIGTINVSHEDNSVLFDVVSQDETHHTEKYGEKEAREAFNASEFSHLGFNYNGEYVYPGDALNSMFGEADYTLELNRADTDNIAYTIDVYSQDNGEDIYICHNGADYFLMNPSEEFQSYIDDAIATYDAEYPSEAEIESDEEVEEEADEAVDEEFEDEEGAESVDTSHLGDDVIVTVEETDEADEVAEAETEETEEEVAEEALEEVEENAEEEVVIESEASDSHTTDEDHQGGGQVVVDNVEEEEEEIQDVEPEDDGSENDNIIDVSEEFNENENNSEYATLMEAVEGLQASVAELQEENESLREENEELRNQIEELTNSSELEETEPQDIGLNYKEEDEETEASVFDEPILKNGLQVDENGNVYYEVKAGDTLSDITYQYGMGGYSAGTYQQLADENEIADPNIINVGQKIYFPEDLQNYLYEGNEMETSIDSEDVEEEIEIGATDDDVEEVEVEEYETAVTSEAEAEALEEEKASEVDEEGIGDGFDEDYEAYNAGIDDALDENESEEEDAFAVGDDVKTEDSKVSTDRIDNVEEETGANTIEKPSEVSDEYQAS